MLPQKLKLIATQLRNIRMVKKGQAGFIAPVGEGPGEQEKGGRHGGISEGKGKLHDGLGFQPQRGEQ